MHRHLQTILSASAIVFASASLPATAAVSYSFTSGASAGPTSVSFEFIVITPQFITTFAQLSPAAASCMVTSPVIESCSIASDISFIPRSIGFDPSISFSALFKPFNSDFAISQDFGASFGVPPGAQVFDTPGLSVATSLLNLSVARLQVSGFADPMPQPIPEPSAWLLLIGGLSLTCAAVRPRRA